jgi:arylsulfatase
MFGNRGIYHDGWVACTTPHFAPWEDRLSAPSVDIISSYKWELYNVAKDFSEANNLAEQNPDKLAELKLLFYAEAAKYNVLPLDDTKVERLDVSIRPSLTRGRSEFTYYEGLTRIPEGAAPDIKNKSFRITANVVLPEGGAQGIIVTQGGLSAGYALMFRDSKPVFHYNFGNVAHYNIAGKDAMAPGKHTVVFDFKYEGGGFGKGGTGTLSVDGKQVAEGRINATIPGRFSLDETFDVGEDTGTPVNEDYDVPFKFTGKIEKVVVNLGEYKLGADDQQKIQSMEQKARLAVE